MTGMACYNYGVATEVSSDICRLSTVVWNGGVAQLVRAAES